MNLAPQTDSDKPVLSFTSCERMLSAFDGRIALEARAIHLWGFELNGQRASLVRFHEWLDAEERSRASRFVDEEDRRRYTCAHGIARAVLSRYVGCAPDTLAFGRQAGGKPYLLQQGWRESLTFSLAHSHGRMLLAVGAQREVGADLEHARADLEVLKLAERFYTVSECSRISALPPEQRVPQFYRHWVAKEAVLKGQGVGLQALRECEVHAVDHGERATVQVMTGSALQPGWNVRWLSCGVGWAAAVACQGEWRLRDMSVV
jgi:4'-phosphopantetheinyl transferase